MAEGVLVFVEGGNPENLEAKAGTDKKLNPRVAPGRNRTRAGRSLGGERSHHSVRIPAPTQVKKLRLFFVH